MTVTVIGVDIAKRVFQVHGINADGKTVLKKRLTRDLFLAEMARHPSCLVGLEAGSGAHHWGRCLAELGHDVRLMPPQYVKPYVKLCSPRHNFNYHQVPIMRRTDSFMSGIQVNSVT